MSWLRASGVAALLLRAGFAHAQTTADVEGTESLLEDVRRVVAAEEVDDWFTDREALRAVEEHLLPSVCRASDAARNAAVAQLRANSSALGDPKALFAARGALTSDVKDALTAQRRLAALEQTLSRQSECPFWIRSGPGFHGLQGDRQRIT